MFVKAVLFVLPSAPKVTLLFGVKRTSPGIFGYDTVVHVSRPHTHTGEGHTNPTALQTCARAKYTKHHSGYKALGNGFFPFVVDTLGRLHDDALRTMWHLASRQIARNCQRRGWQSGGRHLSDYQRDCARRARFLALECAMCEAVAGVRQRLPLAASRGIPHYAGRFTQVRGEGRTARRQWAFHDLEVGTGVDLGGGQSYTCFVLLCFACTL